MDAEGHRGAGAESAADGVQQPARKHGLEPCRKTGPGKAIPAERPVVVDLPPTDPAGWQDPEELAQIRAAFNAGEYRACVEPIEALFFERRNTFHQGLLQYVVALLQLRLGLVHTPRSLLRQALDLWRPYPDWQEGLRLSELRSHAAALLGQLPEGVHSTPPNEVERWWVVPPVL